MLPLLQVVDGNANSVEESGMYHREHYCTATYPVFNEYEDRPAKVPLGQRNRSMDDTWYVTGLRALRIFNILSFPFLNFIPCENGQTMCLF